MIILSYSDDVIRVLNRYNISYNTVTIDDLQKISISEIDYNSIPEDFRPPRDAHSGI